MANRDGFSAYHPIVNFIYFGLVLVFSMFIMNPISLAVSLGASLCYAVYLNGRKAVRFLLLGILPMMAAAAFINPAFSHEGLTILTYLPSGNPLTLESIIYGFAASAMLASVVVWFSCYNAVITSDKFIYLFGRIIPSLSLVLSMTLRFIPRFRAQIKVVSQAQKCIGRDGSEGFISKIKNAITVLSIMVTWSLENAIETADSMKSRGYGLNGRTAFSIYTFQKRDIYALVWLLAGGAYIFYGWLSKGIYWRYYPTVKWTGLTPLAVSVQLVYLLLCLTPVVINLAEDRRWKRYAGGLGSK
ncbi:MAG: energy-coupling factor transporter transmembrane protein EcfT [Clostridia bacterium]|nr:energy-coupling factor transporter transmembrane protein EcfT [Clostridia bacterium]